MMPPYTSLSTIKTTYSDAIVIEIGTKFIRCGYAQENGPRCTICLPEYLQKIKLDEPDFKSLRPHNEIEWAVILEPLLSELLIDRLQCKNTKVHPVVILEAVVSEQSFRQAVVNCLFNSMRIPKVRFLCGPCVSIYTIPQCDATGLVLDIGENECRCMAVYQGNPLLNTLVIAPLGFRQFIDKFMSYGLKDRISFEDGKKVFIDITERMGGVMSMRDDENLDDKTMGMVLPSSGTNVSIGCRSVKMTWSYIIGDGKIKDSEPIIDLISDDSLSSVLLQSILKCPVDLRLVFGSRLIFVGGGAMFPTLSDRVVQAAVTARYSSLSDKQKANLRAINMNMLPPNETVWIGGSILASIETDDWIEQHNWMTKIGDPTNVVSDWLSVQR